MQTISRTVLASAAVLLLFVSDGHAVPKARFSATLPESAVRNGEITVLEVSAEVPGGYHLYSMTRIPDGPLQLKIAVEGDVLSPVSEWHGPKPRVELDPNFDKAIEYYEGTVVHRRAFKVSGAAPGPLRIPIRIKGQICNEERCILARDMLTAALQVEAGPARAERTTPLTLQGEPFPPDRPAPTDVTPVGEGLLGFLIVAFLAGLGALVTPCVFPMIPITISFFSKFAKVSMRRSVTMASLYSGSIVVTFTLVGVLISAIFGAVSMQVLSASPWFNIFLTLLLGVFAFNLFGFFEIQMPSWLIAKTSEKERTLTSADGSLLRQSAGVFFMAVTFTLVSFTCTVAFIGWVLAEAAKGNWFYPAVGMLTFSIAFALPFFVLAVFPTWAEKLQGKGGDWMLAVKGVLGFLELAGAFKFLSNVDLIWQWGLVTRPLVLVFWVVIFGVAGLYLLRVVKLPHSDRNIRRVGPVRGVFAVLLIGLAVYSATGVRSTNSMGGWLDGWLPPAVYPGEETDGRWIVNNIEEGRNRARKEKKPLFIDFTGYTCTNCRYMESAVFPRPEVKEQLDRMVLVSAYTDCEQEVCEKQRALQLERFQTAALPFYAIINPVDDGVLATHPDMTKDVAEYVLFLQRGIAAFERSSAASGGGG